MHDGAASCRSAQYGRESLWRNVRVRRTSVLSRKTEFKSFSAAGRPQTIRTARDGEPRRPPRLSHSSCSELCGLSECWVLLFWIQCRLPLFWLPYIFVPRRSMAERGQWWVGRGRCRLPGHRHHDFHIDPNTQSFWRDHSRLIRSQGSPAYHHVHQHARPTSFRSFWNRCTPTLHLRCGSFGTGGSSRGNLRLYQILSCTKRICCHHASHSIMMSSADWSC